MRLFSWFCPEGLMGTSKIKGLAWNELEAENAPDAEFDAPVSRYPAWSTWSSRVATGSVATW